MEPRLRQNLLQPSHRVLLQRHSELFGGQWLKSMWEVLRVSFSLSSLVRPWLVQPCLTAGTPGVFKQEHFGSRCRSRSAALTFYVTLLLQAHLSRRWELLVLWVPREPLSWRCRPARGWCGRRAGALGATGEGPAAPAVRAKRSLWALLPAAPARGGAWGVTGGKRWLLAEHLPACGVPRNRCKGTRLWPARGGDREGGHGSLWCLLTWLHSLSRWRWRHLAHWPEDQEWERRLWKASCGSRCGYEHVECRLCENVHRWGTKAFVKGRGSRGPEKPLLPGE